MTAPSPSLRPLAPWFTWLVAGGSALNLSAEEAAKPDPAVGAPEAPPQHAAVRFEGTDLHLGSVPPISFHGFASQGFIGTTDYNYLAGDTTPGSGAFNEFGLNVSMTPFKRTRIAAQGFMFDLGDVGNYTPMLDYALADYSFADQFGVRGGRIKRPMGLYNHIQDVDVARTWVLLPQGLYDARFRDFTAYVDGGSFYGDLRLGKLGSLSYELYGGVYDLSQEGGLARVVQKSIPPPPIGQFGEVFGGTSLGGQLWWTAPLPGLRLGMYLAYEDGAGANVTLMSPMGPMGLSQELSIPIQQYSLEYTWKSWTFQGEYRTMNRSTHYYANGLETPSSRSRNQSWFVSGAYRFNDWFETGVYYTEYHDTVSDLDGSDLAVPSDGFQKDLALSFRFDPKRWWTIKAEAHYLRGTSLLQDNASNPVRDDEGWFMLALKTTLSF